MPERLFLKRNPRSSVPTVVMENGNGQSEFRLLPIIIIIALISLAAFSSLFFRGRINKSNKGSDKPVSVNSETAEKVVASNEATEERVALISHYTPWTGGTNCFRFRDGHCQSPTASGERWESWVNKGAACPEEFDFGTKFVLPGGEEFVCVDRGGKIVTNPDGTFWLDLLVASPPVPYGTAVPVEVVYD